MSTFALIIIASLISLNSLITTRVMFDTSGYNNSILLNLNFGLLWKSTVFCCATQPPLDEL